MPISMKNVASPDFWACYDALPDSVKKTADNSFKHLKINPRHPSLHLKRIGAFWSVRIGLKYRALGTEHDGTVIWFWLGTHAEYDALLKK